MNKIRPLQDRVLVKRQKQQEVSTGGILIPTTAQEKPSEGEVLAVGPGKVLADGTLREPEVKAGDVVMFGKYSGTEITVDDEAYVLMREDDILAIVGSR
jgi:chaperonin GroES